MSQIWNKSRKTNLNHFELFKEVFLKNLWNQSCTYLNIPPKTQSASVFNLQFLKNLVVVLVSANVTGF